MAEDLLTDEEQLQEVKRLLKEYGPVLIIGALLGVGGFFGLRYYHGYQDEQGLKAAAKFNEMAVALQLNDTKKAREVGTVLVKDYPRSAYADQAQLTLGRIEVEEGHGDKAVEPITDVMNNSKDDQLKLIARLRLARVLIDQNKPDDAIKLLDDPKVGTFAGRFHEVRAEALKAKKDTAGAVKEYKAALADAETAGADGTLIEMQLADLGVTDEGPAQPKKVTP
jgi:predicted negative regulator of RcsB-dependent stress response